MYKTQNRIGYKIDDNATINRASCRRTVVLTVCLFRYLFAIISRLATAAFQAYKRDVMICRSAMLGWMEKSVCMRLCQYVFFVWSTQTV